MKELTVAPETLDELFEHNHIECFDDSVEINEPLILRSTAGSSGLAIRFGESLTRIDRQTCLGLQTRNAEQSAALFMLCAEHIPLVTLIGKAGSGKTLLALAAALQMHETGRYKRILIARPMVGLGDNDDLGYLPGDIDEKLDVWFGPIYDNLHVLKTDKQKIKKMMTEHAIAFTPLMHIRGRSLNDVFVLIDEAQNVSPEDMKTITTRCGNNVKMVLTGDTQQIDKKALRPSDSGTHDGLSYLIQRTRNEPLVGHVRLLKSERSPLCELLTERL
jgi:PhoH-like ATPase